MSILLHGLTASVLQQVTKRDSRAGKVIASFDELDGVSRLLFTVLGFAIVTTDVPRGKPWMTPILSTMLETLLEQKGE